MTHPITTIEQVRLANLECLRHQIADRLAIVDSEIAEQRKVVLAEAMAQFRERDAALRNELGMKEFE